MKRPFCFGKHRDWRVRSGRTGSRRQRPEPPMASRPCGDDPSRKMKRQFSIGPQPASVPRRFALGIGSFPGTLEKSRPFSCLGVWMSSRRRHLEMGAGLMRIERLRRSPSSCQSRFRKRSLGFSPACGLLPAALSTRIPPTSGCRTWAGRILDDALTRCWLASPRLRSDHLAELVRSPSVRRRYRLSPKTRQGSYLGADRRSAERCRSENEDQGPVARHPSTVSARSICGKERYAPYCPSQVQLYGTAIWW